MKTLVTGSSFYKYEDKKGQTKQGGNITYLSKNVSGQTSEALGFGAISLSVPYESKSIFSKGTGLYDLETTNVQQIFGASASIQLAFVSAEFIKSVDLAGLLSPKVPS